MFTAEDLTFQYFINFGMNSESYSGMVCICISLTYQLSSVIRQLSSQDHQRLTVLYQVALND